MYIYPHNNPEIRTGSMALYREKKPKKEDYYHSDMDDNYFSKTIYEMDSKNWQQSFIAYLKEPEFKVRSWVYSKNTGAHCWVERIENNFVWCIRYSLKNFGVNRKFKKSDLSHYYPGQEVESFKYVREVLVIEKGHSVRKKEWQEVEKPVEMIQKSKWEDKAPLKLLERESVKTNPEYTQFQKKLKSAKILAEI